MLNNQREEWGEFKLASNLLLTASFPYYVLPYCSSIAIPSLYPLFRIYRHHHWTQGVSDPIHVPNSDDKDLVDKGSSGCSSTSKCQQCEGECYSDYVCATGLRCFRRKSSSTQVPGCKTGGIGDVPDHGYCYQPPTGGVHSASYFYSLNITKLSGTTFLGPRYVPRCKDYQPPNTGLGTSAVIRSWTDIRGYSCQKHVASKYCTSDGGYGSGWPSSWKDFEKQRRLGLTARQACCGCGGGTTT